MDRTDVDVEWIKNEIGVRLIDTFYSLGLDLTDEQEDRIAEDAAYAAASAVRCQFRIPATVPRTVAQTKGA